MKRGDEEWYVQSEVDRIAHNLDGAGTSQKSDERVLSTLLKFLANHRDEALTARTIAQALLPRKNTDSGRILIHRWVNRLRKFLKRYNRRRQDHPDFFVQIDLPPGRAYRLAPKLRVDKHEVAEFAAHRTDSPKAWTPFRWQPSTGRPREIQIHAWLPASVNGSLELEFHVEKPWKAPKCKDYERHRHDCLQALRAKNDDVFDGYVWRVAEVTAGAPGCLDITVQPCKYIDYHATSLSLERKIRLDNLAEVTVDEWLAPTRKQGALQAIYPGAASLAVNVLVITRDDWAILIQQRDQHAVSPAQWVASVSGTIEYRVDSKSLRLPARKPDPKRTAHDEVYEEIGIEIDAEQIQWVAFGVGLKKGTPCLLGEVRVNLTKQQVHASFDHRKDRRETQLDDYVKLVPEKICRVLEEKLGDGKLKYPHGTYFELGLALALIRRKKAKLLAS